MEKIFLSKMPLHYSFMQNIIVSAINREKNLFFMLIQSQIISIFPCRSLSLSLIFNGKSENHGCGAAVHDTSDAISQTNELQ